MTTNPEALFIAGIAIVIAIFLYIKQPRQAPKPELCLYDIYKQIKESELHCEVSYGKDVRGYVLIVKGATTVEVREGFARIFGACHEINACNIKQNKLIFLLDDVEVFSIYGGKRSLYY